MGRRLRELAVGRVATRHYYTDRSLGDLASPLHELQIDSIGSLDLLSRPNGRQRWGLCTGDSRYAIQYFSWRWLYRALRRRRA